MVKEIQTTAETTDEAIELALRQLGVERADVEIDVISRGKPGLFGFGGEPAKVTVKVLDEPNEAVSVPADILSELLSKMDVSAMANLRSTHNDAYDGPVFEIEGDDAGLLIGRKGETLRALQFIVRYISSKTLGYRTNLMIDVENYQQRRYSSLAKLTEKVAKNVIDSGRPVKLEPMPSNERRVVHMTLADHPEVTTESMGSGDSRQVVVYLKDLSE